MNKVLISIIILVLAVIEILAIILGVSSGTMTIGKDAYIMLLSLGISAVLGVIISLLRFTIIPRLKYRNIFKLIKEGNGELLVQELSKLNLTSKNSDQYLITLVIANKEVFTSPIFYELINKLTSNNYIFAKHFWLAVKAFYEGNNDDFAKESDNYINSPPSNINTLLYHKIMNYIETGDDEDYSFLKDEILNGKIKNKVIIDVIEKKHSL